MATQIEILDYDLNDLVAVVSTPENKPEPNTFSFNIKLLKKEYGDPDQI